MVIYNCSKGGNGNFKKKKSSKKFQKSLDKPNKVWYNQDVPNEGTKQNEREGKLKPNQKGIKTMTKNTMNAIYAVLSGADFEGKTEVMAELEKELNRGAAEREAKAAMYEAARPVVFEAMRTIGAPATVADIFAEAEKELPEGFTKNKVQYGLLHYWNDSVVKTEGKVNLYAVK